MPTTGHMAKRAHQAALAERAQVVLTRDSTWNDETLEGYIKRVTLLRLVGERGSLKATHYSLGISRATLERWLIAWGVKTK